MFLRTAEEDGRLHSGRLRIRLLVQAAIPYIELQCINIKLQHYITLQHYVALQHAAGARRGCLREQLKCNSKRRIKKLVDSRRRTPSCSSAAASHRT